MNSRAGNIKRLRKDKKRLLDQSNQLFDEFKAKADALQVANAQLDTVESEMIDAISKLQQEVAEIASAKQRNNKVAGNILKFIDVDGDGDLDIVIVNNK